MSMNPIKDKFEESTFFLNHMKENLEYSTDFYYFLHAFLSSAHSIIDLIEEIDKAWMDSQKKQLIYDEMWVFFWKLRNASIHHEFISPKHEIHMTLYLDPIENESQNEPQIVIEEESGENSATIEYEYFFNKMDKKMEKKIVDELKKNRFSDADIKTYLDKINKTISSQDVVALCEDYLAKIDALINDYMNKNSPKTERA